MRRLWRIVVALALVVAVGSGSWACLYRSADPASASTAIVVAIAAVAVIVVGIRAQGRGKAVVAKVRQVVGALGLLLTPVAIALTILSLVDPPMLPWFLLLTVVALLAWMQGIAAQTRLSFRVLARWFGALGILAVVAVAIGGVLVAFILGLLDLLGVDPDRGASLALGSVGVLFGAVLFAWARGRRDRQALGSIVGRAAFGRARASDIALLAAGPRPILRGRPMTKSEAAQPGSGRADWDTRLASIDAALADPSPPDRDAQAGDR